MSRMDWAAALEAAAVAAAVRVTAWPAVATTVGVNVVSRAATLDAAAVAAALVTAAMLDVVSKP